MVRGRGMFGRWSLALTVCLIGLVTVSSHVSRAASTDKAIVLTFDPFASGLTVITDLEIDETGRIYVAEKGGVVRIVENDGTVKAMPFLDLSDRAGTESEQGLSSIIFHPTDKEFFYVNYTDKDGWTHIEQFQVASSGDEADPKSGVKLISVQQPAANHNGDDMAFGPDGYLYIGLGDGGGAGDPFNNAQNGQTLLGSLLRIDVDGSGGYTIPPDNPFVSNPDVRDEIWAMGLRNPWRFSFDRKNGELYIADVGQSKWEEINREAAFSGGGRNYGWRCYEGYEPYNLRRCADRTAYIGPVFAIPNSKWCAIIGGFVYRGATYPTIEGHYLVADYCSGEVWGLVREGGIWQPGSIGQLPRNNATTFGQGPDGELYLADFGNIYKIGATTEVPVRPQIYLPWLPR